MEKNNIKLRNYADENYVYYYVGKNIRKYRKLKGLTQEQLAERTNYCKQFISNIENKTHQTFSVGTVWNISKALEIDLYKLFIEDEDIENEKNG